MYHHQHHLENRPLEIPTNYCDSFWFIETFRGKVSQRLQMYALIYPYRSSRRNLDPDEIHKKQDQIDI
jgi:hypothetical protein